MELPFNFGGYGAKAPLIDGQLRLFDPVLTAPVLWTPPSEGDSWHDLAERAGAVLETIAA